jgi:hypothetical protein
MQIFDHNIGDHNIEPPLGEFLPFGQLFTFGNEKITYKIKVWATWFRGNSFGSYMTEDEWGFILSDFLQKHPVALIEDEKKKRYLQG